MHGTGDTELRQLMDAIAAGNDAAVRSLLAASPLLVERNRLFWTTYWNDLKPILASESGAGLADLALADGGYFAGHVVAAGNPVNPAVRTLLPEDLDAMVPASLSRPAGHLRL